MREIYHIGKQRLPKLRYLPKPVIGCSDDQKLQLVRCNRFLEKQDRQSEVFACLKVLVPDLGAGDDERTPVKLVKDAIM